MDSNNFNNPGAVTPPPTASPKSAPRGAQSPPRDGGSSNKPGRSGSAVARSGTPKHNPNTAVSGVPRQIGMSAKQLDGARSQVFSKPVKRGGLAERQPAPQPHANSRDSRSGLEGAMAAEADRLHPRGRPKVTKRPFLM